MNNKKTFGLILVLVLLMIATYMVLPMSSENFVLQANLFNKYQNAGSSEDLALIEYFNYDQNRGGYYNGEENFYEFDNRDLEHYLKNGGDPNLEVLWRNLSEGHDDIMTSLLHLTIYDDHMVETLLKAGANPNAQYLSQKTPLHLATSKHVVELLLKYGANPRIKDASGKEPIFYFASMSIGEHSGDLRNDNGFRKLEFTEKNIKMNVEIIELLLQNDADINNVTYGEASMLHLVKMPELAQILIDRGADINARNEEGNTPLHISITEWGYGYPIAESKLELAKVLIENGADLNAVNENGQTPSTLAQKEELIDLLYGSNIDLELAFLTLINSESFGSIDEATVYKLKLLLEAGVDPNLKDSDGETMLDLVDEMAIKYANRLWDERTAYSYNSMGRVLKENGGKMSWELR